VSRLLEVRIEKLAPTGEGIVRNDDGVGFVAGALPGELVATTQYEVKKRFWRGRLEAVLEPSPARVDGPHAGCAGCDWAHVAPAAARDAKRALFLETMRRIGRLDPDLFGELPIEASPPAYRLRVRFHAAGGRVGYHTPGSHRVVSAASCEAIEASTRALLPALEEAAAASGASITEVALLEARDAGRRLVRATAAGAPAAAARLGESLRRAFDGVTVRTPEGRLQVERGARTLELPAGGRTFAVSVDTFFQGNRFLLDRLCEDVAAEARRVPPGSSLDAFGGTGLFAGALLSAGHRVQSVEADAGSVADARRTRAQWPEAERWEIASAPVERFLDEDDRRFDVVVVDPPRAGLGEDLARELARRAKTRFVYVSCDPATLARDLAVLTGEGFVLRAARLYDLFAFTHRVEAIVALERAA